MMACESPHGMSRRVSLIVVPTILGAHLAELVHVEPYDIKYCISYIYDIIHI